MKHLLLFFCLILCSCSEPSIDGTCVPEVLYGLEGFTFNSQGGIDSIITQDHLGNLIGVWGEGLEKEGCEVKPDAIECSWFRVVKRDSVVYAMVEQNNTGQERYKKIQIEGSGKHGECSERSVSIEISQCPELLDMELSKYELLFSSEVGIDSVIVITNRTSWLDHPFIGVRYGTIHYIYETIYYRSQYSSWFSGYPIKDPWLAIDIIDGEKIVFSVSKNESGKERNAILTLDLYNCCPSIKVVQSAE